MALMVLFLSPSSHADNEVKLITIDSGDEFWSAFGHTALAVNDQVYGFGYFSFEDEGLIKSFVSNQMYYDLGLSDFRREVQLAEWQNRTFTVQTLALSETEKNQIIQYLEWHNLPENQSYWYDYFLNNCSTKIRDVINEAWRGLLEAEHSNLSGSTYFSETFPAKNQSLMNLGLVLAYGYPAYVDRTDWELMAFPVYLQNKIAEMSGLKVSTSTVLFQEVPQPPLISWFKTHGALVLIFIIFFILLLFTTTRGMAQKALLIIQSLVGWLILGFWLFSGHVVVGWNFNVLLFSPFAFLLFHYKSIQRLLITSYAVWLALACWLGAWYFIPFWVLHMMALKPTKINPQ